MLADPQRSHVSVLVTAGHSDKRASFHFWEGKKVKQAGYHWRGRSEAGARGDLVQLLLQEVLCKLGVIRLRRWSETFPGEYNGTCTHFLWLGFETLACGAAPRLGC